MVTPMQAGEGGSYRLALSAPAKLAPLTLAFVVHVTPPAGAAPVGPMGRPPRPHFVMPLRGRHFSSLIGCSSGSSARQGVWLLPAPPAAPAPPAPAVPAAAPAEVSKAAAAPATAPATAAAAAGGTKKKGKTGRPPAELEFGGSVPQQQPEAPLQQPEAPQPQQPPPQEQPQQQSAAINFSVRCRGADRVCLVLLRPQLGGQRGGVGDRQAGEWGMLELVLDPVLNRTGELWHIAGARLVRLRAPQVPDWIAQLFSWLLGV